MTRRMKRNLSTQAQSDKTNCEPLTHMVKSGINESSECSDRNQNVDCRGKSGKCNMCSAPCKSCSHTVKALMKSGDESAGENYTGNVEIGPLTELCSMGGMNSTSDTHSRPGVQRPADVHDDCLSEVSGTDENAILKCNLEDSRVRYKGSTGERSSSLLTGLNSPNSSVVNPSSRITDESREVQNVHNTFKETSNRHDRTEKETKEIPSNIKDELLEISDEHLGISSQKVGAIDVYSVDTPAAALESIERKEDMLLNVKHLNEDDDSDMVEQDVKVCDICGDAGREDLLAICSRCSDGAEHTYCMRVMLSEVPGGDWLCEECMNLEKAASERPKKVDRLPENERNNSSGNASSEYVNCSDIEGQRARNRTKIPSKRQNDDANAEVSSKLKKQAIEAFVASPKTSSAVPVAASLSRASSSKSLDKERHQSCTETVPVNEITSASSASDLKLQKFRGSFLKSNSFNSLNSKPKVKLVDQAVIQRQKSLKEHGSSRRNDAIVRSLNKSTSFKLTNSVRTEPKVKMLSPRLSDNQDMRTTKQRTPYERQLSIKKENASFISSGSASKIEKRAAFIGESSSLIADVNNQEMKHAQNESKTSALTRSSSLAGRRNLDLFTSAGEFRKPTSYIGSTHGISSGSGVNGVDQRFYQTKEDSSSPNLVARSLLGANGGLPDGLPRPAGLPDFGERTRDYSESSLARPFAKPSKDETPSIRAAIEAAILKRPVTYLKNRTASQSDELAISSSACEVPSHQDQKSGFTGRRNTEQAGRSVASENLTADCIKQENKSNLRQSSVVALQGPSVGGDDADILSSSRDHFNTFPVDMPLFTRHVTIPEHDYIWQGSFEVCRGGTIGASWEGIQAHLSSTSSPKVIEAVKSFKSRVVLNEIPRLSSWPVQFQEHGVSEDNIALYFFAKDLDSYNKIYKFSLDNMMKKDLALKGNIDNVELLIYPSHQLPENSQRWNMMFFLWGVFRAKKESCLQRKPVSSQVSSHQDTVKPVMSFHDSRCSIRANNEKRPSSEQSQLSKAIDGESGVEKEDIGTHNGATLGIISCSGKEQIQVKAESFDAVKQQHSSIESVDDFSKVEASELYIKDATESRTDAGDPSVVRLFPKEDNRIKADLNLEPDSWLDDDDDSTVSATTQVHKENSRKSHNEAPECNDNVGVSLFPSFELGLVKNKTSGDEGGSASKMDMPEKDHDRTPNLELALGGAERKVGVQVHPPDLNGEEEARNDASLSLSLSVPFPAVLGNLRGK